MFSQLFPQRADNTYRGHKVALWIFCLVALLNGLIGFQSTFNTREVATSADGIPLDTFSLAATQTVLSLFALLGVSRIVILLICAVIFFRYRSLVPLMLVVLLLSQLASRVVHYYLPSPITGNPPGPTVILSILGLTALAFGLSLWKREQGESRV